MSKKIQKQINERHLKRYLKQGGKIKKISSENIKTRVQPSYNNFNNNPNPNAKLISEIRIKAFAKQLESELPYSEIWFRSLYEKKFKHKKDKYNQVLRAKYIPDVINHHFKYIIEIDGSMHLTKTQINKDHKKDHYYAFLGYKVFRIKAYDHKSFSETMKQLKKYRDSVYSVLY